MNKLLLVVLVVLAMALSGCASKRWVHKEVDKALYSSIMTSRIQGIAQGEADAVFTARFPGEFDQRIEPLKAQLAGVTTDVAQVTATVEKIKLTMQDIATLKVPVYFEHNKHYLDSAARACLVAKAKVLTRYPKLQLQLVGRASFIGTFKHNVALSKKRAEVVKTFLLSQCVEPGQLTTTYRSYADSVLHDRADRRVDFKVHPKFCGDVTLCK